MAMTYTPDEIAECYDTTADRPCPVVTIEFPSWVPVPKGEFE